MENCSETTLWLMAWEELERGWGRRSDGWSLHSTAELCAAYIDKYWAGMPAQVPDEYERPAWEKPKPVLAGEELSALVGLSGGSMRLWEKSMKLSSDGNSIVEIEPQMLARAEAALLDKAAQAGRGGGGRPPL